MTVGIVGLGYVGLITGAFFAKKGHTVGVYDIDPDRMDAIENSIAPFEEPMLSEYLTKYKENFRFADDVEHLGQVCDIIFICVGTPQKADHSINLDYIHAVCKELTGTQKVVVIKSTVVPGTARQMGLQYGIPNIAMIPEFLAEGSAFNDIENANKVIIGCDDREVIDKILIPFYYNLYTRTSTRIIGTNTVNAEMIKYAQNSMLAMKVTMMNGFSEIIRRHRGGDIDVVRNAIGLDPRIDHRFLKAGAGYGGSCFTKDVAAIACKATPEFEILLKQINNVNYDTHGRVTDHAMRLNLQAKKVAILGLSFKPGTDDMRYAPSKYIIDRLVSDWHIHDENINVYDPMASSNAKIALKDYNLNYTHSIKECLQDTEVAIIVTEWAEIKAITPQMFKMYMKSPHVYDARRIYKPETFKSIGLEYHGVGYSE